MNKNLIIIISSIIGLVAMIGLVYWVFFTGDNEGIEPTGNGNGSFILGGGDADFATLEDDLGETPDTLPTDGFIQITAEPIVGFTILEDISEDSIEPVLRYMLKSNGHIYDYNLETGGKTRVSNTTLTQTFNAEWGNGGNGVFVQHFSGNGETIQTLYIDLTEGNSTSTTRNTLKLVENVQNISVRDNQFAWVRIVNNEALIEVGTLSGINPKTIYRSPFTEWIVSWKNSSTLLLTQKPSSQAKGVIYEIPKSGGKLRSVLSGISGLTFNSNTAGTRVIYSRSTETSVGLYTKALNNDDLPVVETTQTLPEKCAFSVENPDFIYCGVPLSLPDASYPDDWYQGEIDIGDKIELIDTTTGNNEVLYNPLLSIGKILDLVNPQITPDENYFVAEDKKDGTLWRLKI